MKNIKSIITSAAIALSLYATAQDPAASQFYSMPIELNPALMGTNHDIYVNAGYKSQWANIKDGFTTIKGTVMTPLIFNKTNMGKLDGGLSFINDKAGGFVTTSVNAAISYDINLDKSNHLAVALCGGYINKSFDFASQTWGDQYVAGEYNTGNGTAQNIDTEDAGIADAGFGVLWYYQPSTDSIMAFAGVSGYHFYGATEGFVANSNEQLPARYNVIGGIKFVTAKGLDIAPNVRIQNQGGSNEVAFGTYFDYHLSLGKTSKAQTDMISNSGTTGETPAAPQTNTTITLGAWYKQQSQTMSYIVGFQYDKYALSYSYDFAPQAMKTTAFETSTHEITLAFKTNRTGSKKTSPISMW